MLVFFIHGVATRNTEYATSLEKEIRLEFSKRTLPLPITYPSFWGDLLGNTRKLWTLIHSDLQQGAQIEGERAQNDLLRYQDFREGLFSQFVGDFFSYFNGDRGRKIRRTLALQLKDFLDSNPVETEIHIIAHSLGSVILWDLLLGARLNHEKETQAIRSMLQLNRQPWSSHSVRLTSIRAPRKIATLAYSVSPETE